MLDTAPRLDWSLEGVTDHAHLRSVIRSCQQCVKKPSRKSTKLTIGEGHPEDRVAKTSEPPLLLGARSIASEDSGLPYGAAAGFEKSTVGGALRIAGSVTSKYFRCFAPVTFAVSAVGNCRM